LLALFPGSDGGGDNWAVDAMLIENCKLSGVPLRARQESIALKMRLVEGAML
jgi:hypothetical protein